LADNIQIGVCKTLISETGGIETGCGRKTTLAIEQRAARIAAQLPSPGPELADRLACTMRPALEAEETMPPASERDQAA